MTINRLPSSGLRSAADEAEEGRTVVSARAPGREPRRRPGSRKRSARSPGTAQGLVRGAHAAMVRDPVVLTRSGSLRGSTSEVTSSAAETVCSTLSKSTATSVNGTDLRHPAGLSALRRARLLLFLAAGRELASSRAERGFARSRARTHSHPPWPTVTSWVSQSWALPRVFTMRVGSSPRRLQ